MSKHQLTKRSVRRSLSLTAASAMVFALMPLGSAVAQEPTPEPIGNEDVCPPPADSNTGEAATLTDISGVHAENIECVVNYDIAEGYPDDTYRPGVDIKRDQMATFIANYVETATGEALPAGEDAFTDDEDNVHEQNIDKLAGTGIIRGVQGTTYEPKREVSRAAMATFIANAIDYLDDREVNGSIPPATTNNWFDDDDTNTHHDNINRIAEQGIVQGYEDGDYHPTDIVTRGQMATFIIHAAEYADELGLWAPTSAQPVGNQSYLVQPADDQTVETGTTVTFTVTEITSDTVDIALFACDDLTTDAQGIVTFDDANNDDKADRTATDAVITEVNDVAGTYGDHVDNVTVGDDGTITFDVTSDTEECVVAVVWNDANDDEAINLDANNQPTEEFAVSGELTFGAVAALDATPESEVNRYGTDHTITATLEDAGGDTVALDGETVRFQVIRGATCDAANDTITGGTVVATGSDTTEDGVATFTYTLADPSTADDPDTNDCILVFWDEDNDGVFDANEESDVVSKTWSDDVAAATTLNLTPETDTNLVGTQHTVTATVTDQFGDPVDETVRFEVYRDGSSTATFSTTQATGSDGQVSFTYTGPATDADDVIVACVEDADDGDTVCTTDGGTNVDQPGDTAEKFWVEQADATTGDVLQADVIGFDTTADFVDVENNAGDNLRLEYDGDDQFFVDGVAVTLADFEAALSLDDCLSANYNPDGVSTFHLDDECDGV